jgi:hypothetical protein
VLGLSTVNCSFMARSRHAIDNHPICIHGLAPTIPTQRLLSNDYYPTITIQRLLSEGE